MLTCWIPSCWSDLLLLVKSDGCILYSPPSRNLSIGTRQMICSLNVRWMHRFINVNLVLPFIITACKNAMSLISSSPNHHAYYRHRYLDESLISCACLFFDLTALQIRIMITTAINSSNNSKRAPATPTINASLSFSWTVLSDFVVVLVPLRKVVWYTWVMQGRRPIY